MIQFLQEGDSKVYMFLLSQRCFDRPKRTVGKNSNINVLLKQTSKDLENIYR